MSYCKRPWLPVVFGAQLHDALLWLSTRAISAYVYHNTLQYTLDYVFKIALKWSFCSWFLIWLFGEFTVFQIAIIFKITKLCCQLKLCTKRIHFYKNGNHFQNYKNISQSHVPQCGKYKYENGSKKSYPQIAYIVLPLFYQNLSLYCTVPAPNNQQL